MIIAKRMPRIARSILFRKIILVEFYRLRERLLPVLVLMVRLPREGEDELRRVLRLPVLLRFERLPLRPLLGVPEGRDVTVPLLPPPKFGRVAVLPLLLGFWCEPPPTLPWFPLPVPGLWLLSGRWPPEWLLLCPPPLGR